ncbi:hypothetical protein BDW71DRAFT_183146 [Aspergillus fruticulosus]
MRSLFLLWLSLLVASASASVRAGPWQTVLYFYAYRMERDVFGDNPRIATGCAGTNPAGGCSFDEFVKYIQLPGKKIKPWTGSTDIGNNVTPEINHAVDQLRVSGYQDVTAVGKLLPMNFPPKGNTPKMSKILDALTEALENIKTELGGTLDHHPMTSTMRDIVTNIVDARIADNADKTAVSIEGEYEKKGITSFNLEFKTVFRTDGDYRLIDTDKMVDGTDDEDLKQFIKDFCAGDDATQSHNVAKQDFENFQKVIAAGCYV